MAAFDYRQAEEIRAVFERRNIRYLFIGKSGAILLGYPDTTQDADLFIDKKPDNCERLVTALVDLGFALTDQQAQEIRRGKDFIQLKEGPFDLDLVFAPDGIERFEDAWGRRVDAEGFPVCSIDDIILSKQAANRRKDMESLPRLIEFRNWLTKATGLARLSHTESVRMGTVTLFCAQRVLVFEQSFGARIRVTVPAP